MSLDWNLTKIKNYKTVCWMPNPDDPEKSLLTPQTYSIIWDTIATGIGEITADNWAIFYERAVIFHNAANTAQFQLAYTAGDVYRHIGLHTNVFPKETDTKFMKKIMGIMGEMARREVTEFLKRRGPISAKIGEGEKL